MPGRSKTKRRYAAPFERNDWSREGTRDGRFESFERLKPGVVFRSLWMSRSSVNGRLVDSAWHAGFASPRELRLRRASPPRSLSSVQGEAVALAFRTERSPAASVPRDCFAPDAIARAARRKRSGRTALSLAPRQRSTAVPRGQAAARNRRAPQKAAGRVGSLSRPQARMVRVDGRRRRGSG